MDSEQIKKAREALNKGQLEQAYNLAVRFLNAGRQEQLPATLKVQALVIAASSLMLANKPSEAIKLFIEAKSLAPTRTDILAYLARCYLAATRMPEAYELCLQLLKKESLAVQPLITVGVVLSHCQDYTLALDAFQRAYALCPDNPELIFNLAAAYKFNGKFKEAETSYEKAITLRPHYGQAYAGLAEIPNSERRKTRIMRLESLPDSPQLNEYKYYSLAREYEREEHYKLAYEAFSKSAQVRKARSNYQFDQDHAIFTAARKAFNNDTLDYLSCSRNQATPIFIVGMPRTGTTLAERIISSHSSVSGLGELKYLPALIKKHSGSRSNNAISADVFENIQNIDLNTLADDYQQQVEHLHDCRGIFTDKLPINYFNIGLIVKAFPKAKIIILRRKALDTCLSNFRQLFGADSIHQNYSNSIEDVARYYIEFDRLINHWKGLFDQRLFELHYEELVSKPEDTVRSLLTYCDLEWQPDCLSFHKNPKPLATASAFQARQPIYRDSENRASAYKAYLEPAIRILEDAQLTINN